VNRQLEPLGRTFRIALVTLCVLGCLGAGAATGRSEAVADHTAAAIGLYQSPIEPLVVLHPFNPPAHRFGAGKLGVDLTAAEGAVVVAAGAGTVVFAGPVAGRGVVVIAHADGIRTEYEPVRPVVIVGERVLAGARIGVLSGHHVGCAAVCLHWGARRGQAYIDPLSLLHPLGPVRLLPWSATAGSFRVVGPAPGGTAPGVGPAPGGSRSGVGLLAGESRRGLLR
jgi:murein DD-endopeptidase MepM/ murein hydrolase activator NlpD